MSSIFYKFSKILFFYNKKARTALCKLLPFVFYVTTSLLMNKATSVHQRLTSTNYQSMNKCRGRPSTINGESSPIISGRAYSKNSLET